MSGRTQPDIRGVLWLEAETARLHSLEYDYTRYAVAAPLPRSRFGGFTAFRHLPGGGVGVERWFIRMPALRAWADLTAMQNVRRCGPDACDDGTTLRRLAAAGLGIEEEGGAVLAYRLPGGRTLPVGDQAAVAGMVLDSSAADAPAPLAGAEVRIVGGDQRAVTDERGRFRLDNLPAGTYRLAFQHPRLLELGVASPAAAVVEASAGQLATATLAVPSRGTIALGQCGALGENGMPDPDARIIHGVVRDAATGVVIRGARIRLHRPAEQGGALHSRQESGPAGRYLICDAPAGPVRISTDYLGRGEHAVWVEAAPGRPTRTDIALTISTAGRIRGLVLRAEVGEPVAGAMVRIRETGQQAVTDAAGRFVFDSLVAGVATLDVEHLAYRPTSGTVSVGAGERVDVELRVADEVLELDPIVVTARFQPLLAEPRLAGFYMRQSRAVGGSFFDSDDFVARPAIRATDFLRDGTGLRVRRSINGTIISGRRPPSLEPNSDNPLCIPAVYLDGALISTAVGRDDPTEVARLIDQFPVSELAGIEVYPGAASVPGEFARLNTDCGVVAVWTRARDRSRPDGSRPDS